MQLESSTQELYLISYTQGVHIQTWTDLEQYDKQYHVKVLLNSFHLNGHTLGIHSQN